MNVLMCIFDKFVDDNQIIQEKNEINYLLLKVKAKSKNNNMVGVKIVQLYD